MAAQSAALPSLIIYDTGLEALPIEGYDGTAPSPTLAALQADIRHGLFHLVWIASATDPRLRWIAIHCTTKLTKRLYYCGPARAGLPVAQPAPVPQPVPAPEHRSTTTT